MHSTITYRTAPTRPAPDRGREVAFGVSARHELLSGSSRAASVRWLESAIARLDADSSITNTCAVTLFEIEGDTCLHCNVTHRHLTRSVAGWVGPGHVAGGFVHNRRFRNTRPTDILQHIREMVFAPRV